MTDHARQPEAAPRRRGMGFTLIELLVVMAVIAIIGSIVIVAFAGFAREARLSSGTNTVLAALGNARAEALKNNRLVLVAVVPRLLDGGDQVVEIVTAEWTGDTFVYGCDNDYMVNPGPGGGDITEIVDRFVPIPDQPVRQLPRGIKVAGPLYADSANIVVVNGVNTGDRDSFWATQAHLPALVDGNGVRLTNPPPEAPGRILAVMFSPDGSVVDSNPESDASLAFIDSNRNARQDFGGESYFGCRFDVSINDYVRNVPVGFSRISLAEHLRPEDEPVVTFVPFLSLYDDAAARKLYVGSDPANDPWTDVGQRDEDLRAFLTENASRIHFNSYTGVAMR